MTSFNLAPFVNEKDILFFDAKASARLDKHGNHLIIEFSDENRASLLISKEDFYQHLGSKILPTSKVDESQLRQKLTLGQQEKILRAERTVDALRVAGPGPGGKKHRIRICKEVAEKYGYVTPTPPKTAYNWYVAYHTVGLYTYFTSREHKQNKTSRFASIVREMADDLLMDTMFSPGLLKIKLSTVHRYLKRRVKRLDPTLKVPSYETLRAWFYEYDPYLVKLAKDGLTSTHKIRAQNVTRNYSFFRPLQRVEADAMHVTINMVDENNKPIAEKIIIYFLVDCFSRSVMGFHLQLGAGENESGVIKSIRKSIQSKDDTRWIQHGLPTEIVVDGGTAYRSLNTQAEILSLGIMARIVSTGAGYRKPFVERFIRTCRDCFFSTLPGYLGKQEDQKRADTTISKAISYTKERIEQQLTRWIVEDYHQRRHLGLYRSTPLAVWRQGIVDYPVTYLQNHAAADAWLGQKVYPTISGQNCHMGVQINSIRYNDTKGELQRIGIYLKNKNKPAKIECFWNESDISHISVIDPITNNLIRVPSVNPHVKPDMSKNQFDELIGHLYPFNTEEEPSMLEDLFDDTDFQKQLKAQTKTVKQKKSRAAPAKEGELAIEIHQRLTEQKYGLSKPIVSTQDMPCQVDDEADDGDIFDYE